MDGIIAFSFKNKKKKKENMYKKESQSEIDLQRSFE